MYQAFEVIGVAANIQELKYTPGGDAMLNFSIPVNNNWTGKDGQKHEETMWVRVTIWRKLAETMSNFITPTTKGQQVFVTGRLIYEKETGGPRIWKAQDGTPRTSFEMEATTIKLLGGKRTIDGSVAAPDAPATNTPDEEIPF